MRLFIPILFTLLSLQAMAGHRILSPQVKSLQVTVGNDWTAPLPIMRLGTNDVLNVGFDELSHNYHRFIARLEHCEADWSPSTGLFENDWLEGFNDLPIDDYDNSLNTTVLYSHYRLQIPNSQCRLKMSGNYRLHILDEDDGGNEILVAEFRVLEPLMNIGLNITSNTDLGLNSRYQQVSMTVNYNSLRVTNVEDQLKVIVLQNGCEEFMKTGIKPSYITQWGLQWEHCRELVFEGGNEYHKFEMLDPTHTTMGLDRVWWDDDQESYHAAPLVCEPRSYYLYDEDANGAFLIRNSNDVEAETTCEYIYVHYKVKPIREYEDSKIILQGKWTVEDPDSYVMYYDEKDRSYNATILQKMGYYNYQLLRIDAAGQSFLLPEEGSFFQTANSYQVLVYYRGTGERTWRLNGYRNVDLHDIQQE